MFSYLFTFRSQTAAQSGRRILYEAGLWTQLRRAPQEVSSLGFTLIRNIDRFAGRPCKL